MVLFLAAAPFFDLIASKPAGGLLVQALWAGLYLLAAGLLTLRFRERWVVWSMPDRRASPTGSDAREPPAARLGATGPACAMKGKVAAMDFFS
jgi:hypothetical protein